MPGGNGGTGATAGAPGAGSGGAGGSGGAVSVDCGGNFGTPSVVLSVPGVEIGSLAPSSDELELIYSGATQTDVSYTSGFYRSARASKDVPFAPGTPLPELDAACADSTLGRSGDLSADGLRFYFVCYSLEEADPLVALHVARRASPGAAFVVDSTTYGTVRPGPAISADELTLFTSASRAEIVGANSYVRPSASAPFGSATILAGLETVITPDLSSDGRFLFGSVTNGDVPSALVVAERASTNVSFASYTPVLTAPDLRSVLGSPAISQDCRSLYYVLVANDPIPLTYSAMVVKR